MSFLSKSPAPLLHHLLSTENLDKDTITYLLDRADHLLEKQIQGEQQLNSLQGKVIANLFFEPSTRTRNSFEIAAKRLGAIVLSPEMSGSATSKGESLIDTIHTFEAMGAAAFVIRHREDYTAQFVASELQSSACVINAGDGMHQHPTQALLDLLTIRQHKKTFEPLTVAIIGDIAHSRVVGSIVPALKNMGVSDLRLVAPKLFIPKNVDSWGVEVFHSLEQGLQGADVVMALRIQKERIQDSDIPDMNQFFAEYGLTQENLSFAKRDAIVMHPGPLNRGVEIDSSVADGPQSVILQQVRNGVAVRMAVLDTMLN